MAIDLDITEAQSGFIQQTSRTSSYIGGIGSGKSFILTLWAIIQALKGRTVLYILPSYPMVRDIAFPLVMEHLERLKLASVAKLNKSTATLTIGKGVIMFRSAETGDRIRGVNAHDLAFDEAGFITKSFYLLAIGRVRKAANGMIRAVGTPCGRTWFTEFDNIYTQSTFANPFIPRTYKDQLAQEYTGEFARQELYGEILDSDGNQQWLPTATVNKAILREPLIDSSEPIIAALDVARYGADRSVLMVRRGNKLMKIRSWIKNSIPQLAREVSDLCMNMGVVSLVIDAVGLGAGCYDMVEELIGSEINVCEYNSGFKPSNPKYYNLRAESYGDLRKWMEESGSLKGIPDTFRDELTELRYNILGKNKIIMESKDQYKRRGNKSPDFADALAMSFWDGIKLPKKAKKKTMNRRRSAWAS